MQKKIWVTGANGQLGTEIRGLSEKYSQFVFIFSDIDTLDLTDASKVSQFMEENQFNYVINCAAYTAVDKAEEDVTLAYQVNRNSIGYIAETAQQINAKVIHISTDYVFDGEGSEPYRETDPTNPQSVYGKSKLEGEEILRKSCPESIIIRTAWLYSSHGNNFVKTMMRLGRERESLNVVADQKGTPTYAGDLAQAVLDIITWVEHKENLPVGIYHYSNLGEITWYDFALKIHELAGITGCKVAPVGTDEYPVKAKRPQYSVLNKNKIQQTFQLQIPDWEDSLKKCISILEPTAE